MQLEQGATKDSILSFMKAGGWSDSNIDEAFTEASKGFQKIPSSESFMPTPAIGKKRYLLSIIKVLFLLIIIMLCVLYFLGGSDTPINDVTILEP